MLKIFFTIMTLIAPPFTYSQDCKDLFGEGQITYNGSSKLIADSINQLQKEFEKAVQVGGILTGQKLDLRDIKIKIADARESNGVANIVQKSILVMVSKNRPDKHKIADLWDTFFHELGHHIFASYLFDQSPSYRKFIETLKQEMKSDPTDINDFKKHLELINGFTNFKTLTSPYEELMADIFRVIFLKKSGETFVSRDLSDMSSVVHKNLAYDEHHTFNPVRKVLWKEFFRNQINNPDQLYEIYQALAASVAEEIERQQPFLKSRPNVLDLNWHLLNRLRGKLSQKANLK